MMKLVLSEGEFSALLGLLDAGVRANGIRALRVEAVALLRKLEEAEATSNKGKRKGVS